MRLSLIQVYKESGGFVDGVWLQDHTGTPDTAAKTARETEKANKNRIAVAVVEKINGSCPNYCLRTKMKRLDQINDKEGNEVFGLA